MGSEEELRELKNPRSRNDVGNADAGRADAGHRNGNSGVDLGEGLGEIPIQNQVSGREIYRPSFLTLYFFCTILNNQKIHSLVPLRVRVRG